jgi:hypothetical protein
LTPEVIAVPGPFPARLIWGVRPVTMLQYLDSPRVRPQRSLLLALTLIGCASTIPAPERAPGLTRFVALPAPAIVSHPRGLTVDESLLAMRQGEIVAPLAGAFDSVGEVTALLRRIQGAAPTLRQGVPELLRPDVRDTNGRSAETPVLFIWPTWKVSYRRLPPRLGLIRLEFGVIAKVIPRGQVMDGRGPIALRTAYWEAQCHRHAEGGAYVSVRDWLADNAARWRQAMEEVREACGEQLGTAFEHSVAELRGVTAPARGR